MTNFRTRLVIEAAVLLLLANLMSLAPLEAQTGAVNLRTSSKGTTIPGAPTSTDVDANRQALDVYVRGGGSGGGTVDQGTGGVSAWKVDGSAVTQPISAAALPLPSGAATATKQDTGNTSLASIDGKLPALSGGRIPVDPGTVAVTGTFFQATQPVSLATMPSTPVTGTFWQVTQPVSIATMPSTPVTGTFWQTTQPVSGTVTANAGTNLNTSALALESGGNLASIAGKDFATQTTLALVKAKTDNLDVALSTRLKPADTLTGVTTVGAVTSITNPVAVTGTFWQATQPVSLASIPLPADTVGASGSLNAQDAAVTVAMAGQASLGVFVAAGTLVGTIVPECSMDGGTTWTATLFDQGNATKMPSKTWDAANTTYSSTLISLGGCSHYRVRVSGFASGTATATLRATSAIDPSVLFAQATSAIPPPANAVVAGIDGSGRVRPLSVSGMGAAYVQPAAASLLPPCNEVRRRFCATK